MRNNLQRCVAMGLILAVITGYCALVAQEDLPVDPPCGYGAGSPSRFHPCEQPIQKWSGRCDALQFCQPYYACYPINTPCFTQDPPIDFPKRRTRWMWLLGTCIEDSFQNCSVCPQPCHYVCAVVWPARDQVHSDGSVTPCGVTCSISTYYFGAADTCH